MIKKGFSLALTLWVVAMMGLASALYLNYAHRVVHKSINLKDKLLITLKAESMVELIKFYGSTGKIYFNLIENSKIKIYDEKFPSKIFIDGRETLWGKMKIYLQDTGGLLNLSDTEAIANYIAFDYHKSKDKKAIILNSIEDWLDEDSLSRLGGAESDYYQKYGYGARNKSPLSSVEELFLIKGIRDYNNDKRDTLRSLLVVTNNPIHNILTLDKTLLQRIYGLSITDIVQLEKLKKISISQYIEFFNRTYKENYNFEIDGFYPSNILKIHIVLEEKGIRKEIVSLIDFRAKHKAFSVLEYHN